jgi:protein-S-isoprenylcysteine O-methyltransferase Ste14
VLTKLIATIVMAAISVVSMTRYGSLNDSYDRSRTAASSDYSFKVFYKALVGVAAVCALAAFWSNAAVLMKVYDSAFFRIVGSLASITGLALFESAIRALGSQYSPCFDLRKPTLRVTNGPYRWLSHPMYVGNLAILLGAFIASGSIWVLAISIVVATYYFRSADTERRLLD